MYLQYKMATFVYCVEGWRGNQKAEVRRASTILTNVVKSAERGGWGGGGGGW